MVFYLPLLYYYKSLRRAAQGFPLRFSAGEAKSIENTQKICSKIGTCHKNAFRGHFPLEKSGRFRYNIPRCQPGERFRTGTIFCARFYRIAVFESISCVFVTDLLLTFSIAGVMVTGQSNEGVELCWFPVCRS